MLARPVRIGVVIASYNEFEALPEAVHRLMASSVDRVVVVDSSTDPVSRQCAGQLEEEAGERWGARALIVTDAPGGRAIQMNIGAERLDTDILLFLHVDTELPPDAMQAIRDLDHDRLLWGRFDVRIDDAHWAFRMIETAMNLRSSLSGICTGDQCIFVSEALFKLVDGFPPIALMEDIELSRRLKKQSRPVILPSRVSTSSRRWRHFGIFRTMVLMWGLRLAHWLGVAPDRLARWYRRSNDSATKADAGRSR